RAVPGLLGQRDAAVLPSAAWLPIDVPAPSSAGPTPRARSRERETRSGTTMPDAAEGMADSENAWRHSKPSVSANVMGLSCRKNLDNSGAVEQLYRNTLYRLRTHSM